MSRNWHHNKPVTIPSGILEGLASIYNWAYAVQLSSWLIVIGATKVCPRKWSPSGKLPQGLRSLKNLELGTHT